MKHHVFLCNFANKIQKMSDREKILSWLQPYVINIMVLVGLIFLLKAFLGFVQHDSNDITVAVVGVSIIDAVLATGFLSLIIFPVYVLVRLVSSKASVIVTSFICAFILLLEISLTVFTMKSGALMDNEIFLRPFNEVVETMQSGVSNLWLILVGFVIFMVLYCWLMNLMVKCLGFRKKLSIFIIVMVILTSSFIWLIPKMEDTTDPNKRNFIADKTWYLIRSTMSSDDLACAYVEYDESKIKEYISMHSGRNYPDLQHPMEFVDNTKDNLSRFFRDSDDKPNIVLLIVESLGNEWMGTKNTVAPIMPFVDSLSRHSLYWENCLSTTPRSFGAVPALTGSVTCGIRGYQFGNMPKTNTLIGILKSNGYATNAFYSGQFYFDCIAEYLISQKIDYMSDFYKDYEADKDKNKGCFWGYHDEFLFDKSIKVLEDKKGPMFNMFVTISTHDEISKDNPVFAKAVEKADKIVEKTREVKKVTNSEHNKAITFAYTDDCLKKFFVDYSKRDDFENTIFIITGDHGSGYFMKSDLSRYHVPLIIYSPLLKESEKFKNVVTHNDLVPSLVMLMKNNYHLDTPEKESWAGSCLGVDEDGSGSEMLFVEYAKGVTKILSDGLIYKKEDDKTYKITDDMTLSDASDDPRHEMLRRKMEVYKYVNDYVYLNDKLVSECIFKSDKYNEVLKYNHSDVIECHTSADKHWVNYFLLPDTKIKGQWEKIKISFSADVSFLDELDADQYMDLYFYCSGNNHNYPDYYTDKIVKFFPVDKIEVGEWYKLNVDKEFVVKDATDLKCYIYTYYSKWMESNRALFKNIKIEISGV